MTRRLVALSAIALGLGACGAHDSKPPSGAETQKPAASQPVATEDEAPDARDCVSFTSKVNEALKKVVELTQKNSQTQSDIVADMGELAATYDQLAVDIGAMDFKSKKLEGYAAEYREMCGKAASAARQVANAVRTKNAKQAETAEKDFGKIVKEEDGLVDRINALCRTGPSQAS